MFQRLFNWFNALFNSGMDQVEDPKIMLKSQLRELEAKRSKLNDALAGYMAIEKTQSDELDNLSTAYQRKVNQVKALAEAGKTEQAEAMAGSLVGAKLKKEELETSLVKTKANVQQLQQAVELASTNITSLKRGINESLQNSEIAKIKKEVATTMESFDSDDSMFNIKEMTDKLNMQNAKESSALEVALNNQKDSIASMEADKELQKLEGKKLLADILK